MQISIRVKQLLYSERPLLPHIRFIILIFIWDGLKGSRQWSENKYTVIFLINILSTKNIFFSPKMKSDRVQYFFIDLISKLFKLFLYDRIWSLCRKGAHSIENNWKTKKNALKKSAQCDSHFNQNIMSTFMTHGIKKSDEFKLMEPSST